MEGALEWLQHLLWTRGAAALPPETTQMTWSRFFDAYEPVDAMVAESSGKQLVGLVHYLFHRSTSQIDPICYPQNIFTVEAACGRRIFL